MSSLREDLCCDPWKTKSRNKCDQRICVKRERNEKEMKVKEENSDLQAVNKEMIVWKMNGPAEALLIAH